MFAGRAKIPTDHAYGGLIKSAIERANATGVRLIDFSEMANLVSAAYRYS